MKIIRGLIKLQILMLMTLHCACAQEYRTIQLPDHPRILFNQEDEKKLMEFLPGNNFVAELHRMILAASDEMIASEPVVYQKTGRRLLSVSRTCLRRVVFLSYSYRITEDKKYMQRAEKEMLAAAAFEDWNPDHFLDVAEMTAALAIGYDWLYDQLSDPSRSAIRDAIVNKGLLPSRISSYNGWLERVNNWNQVCNGGLSLGALAIYEDEPVLAQEILDRAIGSLTLPLQEYEPDGAYPEGSTYWAYGTMYHVLFIDAYRKIFPHEDQPEIGKGFMNSGYYFLHVFGPQGSFNYSDGVRECEFTPAIFWFARERKDNTILFHQDKLLQEILQNGDLKDPRNSHDRYLPMIPIWASGFESLEINEPRVNSWTGRGKNPVSFHRSSWDEDGIFVGVKGGSPSASHAHMDVGTFVMDARGVRWAMDLGKHDYHELESRGLDIWNREQDSDRWKIFRYSNYSHNTLTVNNELQRVEGQGEILKVTQDDNFRGSVLDISSAYTGLLTSAFRGVAIVENRYVVIRDEVVNKDASATLRWTMLTQEDIEILDEATALIRKDGKELKFLVAEPENVKIQTYSTEPQIEFEEKNPGTRMIGFEVHLQAGEELTLVIVLVPGNDVFPETTDIRVLSNW